MTKKQFDQEMQRIKSLMSADPDRTDYFTGYIRGLKRAYSGGKFGIDNMHNLWMNLIFDTDMRKHARGLGYRDGMQWDKA